MDGKSQFSLWLVDCQHFSYLSTWTEPAGTHSKKVDRSLPSHVADSNTCCCYAVRSLK